VLNSERPLRSGRLSLFVITTDELHVRQSERGRAVLKAVGALPLSL